MTAASAAAPTGTCPATAQARCVRPRQRTACLYLAPALIVMGIITFFPLVFQVFIFFDFRLPNIVTRLASRTAPAEFVGLDNYVRILKDNLGIPNFNFFRQVLYNLWWAFANVAVHVTWACHRAPAQRQGPAVQDLLAGALHPARGHPAHHRGDRLAQHVRHPERRHQRAAHPRRRAVQDPGGGAPDRLAAFQGDVFPFLPSESTTSSRSRSSRSSPPTPGWAGRSTRWSPPGRSRASRASCTRPPRWTAPATGRSSGT